MTTIEKLKAKHAEELASAELEQRILSALSEKFPDLETKDVVTCVHSLKSKPHVSVRLWNDFRTQKKLSDALPVLESFKDEIVECEHWKGSCISCWPPEINTNIDKEHATMDGSHAVEIEVSGGKGYGPKVEIQFWTRLADTLCEITLPVSDLWMLVPNVRANYNRNGEVTTCEINWPVWRSTCDTFRSFWSEKPSYNGHYYSADIHNFLSWAGSLNAKTA